MSDRHDGRHALLRPRHRLVTAPFGIGAGVWPGVAKAAEEAGELVQVIGKLIATAGEPAHYDGSDLRERLVEECGDLLAAIGYLTEANGIAAEVAARAARKRALFQGWHDAERARAGRSDGPAGGDREAPSVPTIDAPPAGPHARRP